MNSSESQTNQTNQPHYNTANNIPHDSNTRGYSVENSFYDSPFNMDFEYGYLNLMFNINAFTARTQDMFQSLERNMSGIIELQNQRRRFEYEFRRTRETRETRENNQNSNIQHASQGNSDSNIFTHSPSRQNTANTGLTDNLNYLLGRRNIFDSSNNMLFSFLPRNVLLNPTTLPDTIAGNTGRTNRRNRTGLTIQDIEENTEIITYGSIDMIQRLNTECPISRDTFNENSVVLRLKECRHCFVPFRMMTWLESHSTCPLCRCNVAPSIVTPPPPPPPPPPTAGPNAASTNTFSNILNNIRNSTNLNNLSIDNMNDDSIVFSFDLPRLPNDTYGQEFGNTYLSSLSEIFSNFNNNNNNNNNSNNSNNSNSAAATADAADAADADNMSDHHDHTTSQYDEVD